MQADVAIREAAVQVQIVDERKGVQVGGAVREAALQVSKDTFWRIWGIRCIFRFLFASIINRSTNVSSNGPSTS